MKPNAIDLFCGAGGMSEGILQAGFHILFSSDINEDVEKTYRNRHDQLGLIQGVNTFFKRADIRELPSSEIIDSIQKLKMFENKSLPKIDAIFGGPPCQGFSRAGQRKKDDPRNMLFKEYLRIINDLKPSYVVMENVEGFNDTRLDGFIGVTGRVYPDNSLVPEILRNEFDEIGYNTLIPQVLDSSDFGVPQRRRRVIFIGYLNTVQAPAYPTPTTPNETDKVTVLDAISDLIVNQNSKLTLKKLSKYQTESQRGRTMTTSGKSVECNSEVYNHDLAKHNELITERFSLFREGESSAALIRRIRNEGIDLRQYPSLLSHCESKLTGYTNAEIIDLFKTGNISDEFLDTLLTKKSNRFRLNRNSVAPTMVTLPDDYLTPFEDRIPTVREMARIQSFDDSFKFLGKRTTGGPRRKIEVPQYTQVGNAVPPLLARAIALEIMRAIELSQPVYQLS